MRFRTCSLALLVAVVAVAAVPPAADAAPPIARVDSVAPSAPSVTYQLHRMDSVASIRIDSLALERVSTLRGVTTSGALTTTPTRALAQPASAIHQGMENIMSASMRAKMRISSVQNFGTAETLNFACVTTKPFGPEGESEDNTFARFTPTGTASYQVTNPALVGVFKVGDTFYVDFIPADQPDTSSTLAALRESVAGDSAAAG